MSLDLRMRKVVQSSSTSRVAGLVAIAIVLALISAAGWADRGLISLLMEFCCYLALAQMWNLLAGFAGIVSLGQQAFLGIGGYALFFAALRLGWNPSEAFLLAGVAGAVVAIPGALIVFRLQGAYLAIGTWVLAEVLRLIFSQVASLGAGSGISLPVTFAKSVRMVGMNRDVVLYLAALGLALATVIASYMLLRSERGLALTAIRDNELGARSSGVSSFKVKLLVFSATGLGTGFTGALLYLAKLRISPGAAFDVNWTSYMIFMVVIGGVGTLEGPIAGTLVYFVLRQYLADLGSWYLIILGVVAVTVMLKLPMGIWGTVARKYDLSLFPTRRRVVFDETAKVPDQRDGVPEMAAR
jgi:branched-chain amino acid transport system permease protein